MPASFHEVRFPLDIALGAAGGPEWRTDVVTLGSGAEHRNARWSQSRRRYDAGYGIKTLDALHAVLAFFEERRGRLHGFRWHDRLDCRSGPPSRTPAFNDQRIGEGDGASRAFRLVKSYGTGYAPYLRRIVKPVAGTVVVGVGGAALGGGAFGVDTATGVVTLAQAPPTGVSVTAGFAFDVPVRFDTDALTVDLAAFSAGAIPTIPLIEIIE
ncbi:MAG: phage distal tail protein, Rcc01695 family [Pseudochelatococcus sp.]|uniref:phage distal tail protein, Rcc01695 family n=1 Tax=Pseudochelatococcus sp. TaxID=2020869 RepID=UPI003D8D7DB4